MLRDTRSARPAPAFALAFAAGVLLVACHRHSPPPSPPPGPIVGAPPGSEPVVVRPVVTGPAGRLLLTFEDQLSSSFRLDVLTFAIDGQTVQQCADGERVIDANAPLVVFDGDLSAGQHELEAKLEYRGHGEGIFSYLSGYTFQVRGTHAFALQEAQFLALHAVAYERRDITTPIEDRPQLRFEDRSTNPIHATGSGGCPWLE